MSKEEYQVMAQASNVSRMAVEILQWIPVLKEKGGEENEALAWAAMREVEHIIDHAWAALVSVQDVIEQKGGTT